MLSLAADLIGVHSLVIVSISTSTPPPSPQDTAEATVFPREDPVPSRLKHWVWWGRHLPNGLSE